MTIVHTILNMLFFLPASAWLGGLVMLALASRQIEKALSGRRTEAWQINRRLRAIFQKLELATLAAMWVSSVAQMVLETVLKDKYPGTWGTADAMRIGLMVVPTLAALYSTFYLTGAIRSREDQLGSYEDKDQQILVRKRLSLLHLQARAIVWLNIGFGALVLLAAVIAVG